MINQVKINYTILVIVIAFISCSRNVQNEEIENIKISIQEMSHIEKDSIIEDVNLIPLETNDDCLITHIDKIKLINNKFYILDRKSGSILIFNNSGQFLSKISKQGKGEGEYLMIADFDVHFNNDDIYILDGMTGNLLVYRNNEFIKNIKLGFGAKVSDICFLENGNVAFETQMYTINADWKYHLLITDENFNLINKKIPYQKTSSIVISPVTSFVPFGSIISYLPIYRDTIFHITNNEISPKYKLDFGKNWMDNEFLFNKNINPNNFIQGLERSNSIYSLNTIESSNHVFIYFYYKGDKYAFLYDKKSMQGRFIENYMKNNCEYNGLPMISDGDKFVCIISPFELANVLEKTHPLLNKIDSNSNPIISYVKYKTIN